MNNLTIILEIFLCFFLVAGPRRLFLFPFFLAACFVPMDQKFLLYGLNFNLLRILIIFGFLRLVLRSEIRIIQWNNFDKLLLTWVSSGSLIYIIQQGTINSIIYRSGVTFDCLGMYWLFRQTLCDWEEVFQAVKLFAIFSIITAPLIVLEKFEISNFFSLFGATQGQFHRGRFQAAGPFPHYIMMGSFWASLLPFFYARIKARREVFIYWLAIIASLSNVYCSASSTSIFTVVAIIFFWQLYNFRTHGKFIFWGTCVVLVLLHLVMNKPVWHLMSRVDIFGGSTGWHRFHLVDQFFKNTAEWFFLGTESTKHWGAGLEDITNQFALEGINGGIITLLLFVALIYRAVKIPGILSMDLLPPAPRWMSWGICVAALGHFVTFWGVSYFGQINMLLYFTFALVGFTLEKSLPSHQSSSTSLDEVPNSFNER